MEKKIITCPKCQNGHYEGTPCWLCEGNQRRPTQNTTDQEERVDIPQGNIDTYLHWYKILKEIQEMKFEPVDFDEPLKILRTLQKEFSLDDEWLWTAYKPINMKQCDRADLFNPFLRVWHYMQRGKITHKVAYKDFYLNTPGVGNGSFNLRDYSKKREGVKANWALNVLLCGLVDDCHWYGKGKKFVEARAILDGLSIPEANTFEYDSFQRHCREIDRLDIDNLLKTLYKACIEKKISFIPPDTSISEWPMDFLSHVADHTGYKTNPTKHLTDQMEEALPEHLKKLLKKQSKIRK